MIGPTRMSEGPALVEEYEALRKEVLEPDGHSQRVRAVALLMRKGMAAWMKHLSEHHRSITAIGSRSNPLPVSSKIEQRVVEILATMTLAATWEAMT
jgi:hypothetical protein